MYFSFRLFQMTTGFRTHIALAALAGLLAIVCGIGRLALSGVVIARVFQGDPLSSLVPYVIVIVVLVLTRALFQYLKDLISDRTASKIKVDLRQRLYRHVLELGPGHFDQRRTGDVLMFLVEGVETLEAFFGQYLPQFFVAAIAPILIFGFMATLDIYIGAIFLVAAIATFFLPSWLHRMNRHLSLARRDTFGEMGADFLDSIQGIATLKAFGQSRLRGRLLKERARKLYSSTMRVFLVDGISNAATILTVSGGAALALGWGALRVNSGDIELQSLLIVLMLGAEVFRPLKELTQLYHQGMTAMASAEGVFALLDSPVTVIDPVGESCGEGTSEDEMNTEVIFENVTLAYDGGRRSAVQDLSFTLKAGETLGMVGASGAGKSTVVWLLLRFLDPQQGRILLGGRDVRNIPIEELRSQIAVVTQDTYLFHGTVAENLRLAKQDATQEEVEESARAANAHDFIVALPRGYETLVGERGIMLSGGQRQRIAIARALLKPAPILVLDEALSSVDAANELNIRLALDRLAKEKTTLVIAHRLSSVSKADRILVLDKGSLVESGTHQELTEANGVYARLMARQHSPNIEGFIATDNPQTKDSFSERTRTADPEKYQRNGQTPQLSTWDVWKRLLELVSRWWWELLFSLFSGLIYHGATIGLGVIGALLVRQIYKGGEVGFLLTLLGVTVPLCALARWTEAWASHDLAYRLLAEMRITMYNKLEPLAPGYTSMRRSGDLASVIGGDVESIENFYAHVVTPSLVALLLPAGVLITLMFVSWPLALVLIPFLAVAATSPFIAQNTSERLGAEMRHRLGDLNAFIVDGIQGLREISAFGVGKVWLDAITMKGQRFAGSRLHFLRDQALQGGVIESVTALGGVAVLTVGVWLVGEGWMAQSTLPLVTLLALSSFAPVTELARTLRQLMETLAASRRVFEVHDEPIEVNDGPGVGEFLTALDGAPSLVFDNVTFTYSSAGSPALQGINFSADPGETIALVGRSGAGKSTIANMLMRFWDPDYGTIRLGGHNLCDFTLDELREHVAMVSQDTYLFNTTIRDNLEMGRHNATYAEIQKAALIANAHEFIEAFPDGYDTEVGERGVRLSGGQRQRLSIARAVLKDAPMLVLDEATSHLDAISEQQVREALQRLMRGRTTLVIAHRLSTVRDADRIVVLEGGRVEEEGTHQSLLRESRLYANLVSSQLADAGK